VNVFFLYLAEISPVAIYHHCSSPSYHCKETISVFRLPPRKWQGLLLGLPEPALLQAEQPFPHWVNHRMMGVGRALCGSPSPTPCRSRVTQTRLHSTVSRRVWNISREGDSTASLGSLGQGSVKCSCLASLTEFCNIPVNPFPSLSRSLTDKLGKNNLSAWKKTNCLQERLC